MPAVRARCFGSPGISFTSMVPRAEGIVTVRTIVRASRSQTLIEPRSSGPGNPLIVLIGLTKSLVTRRLISGRADMPCGLNASAGGLSGCDLVGLQVRDVFQGSHVAPRAIVMQKKTQRPVQFEITEQTRDAVGAWIAAARLKPEQFLFPSRMSASPHLSTRQYSRLVRPL